MSAPLCKGYWLCNYRPCPRFLRFLSLRFLRCRLVSLTSVLKDSVSAAGSSFNSTPWCVCSVLISSLSVLLEEYGCSTHQGGARTMENLIGHPSATPQPAVCQAPQNHNLPPQPKHHVTTGGGGGVSHRDFFARENFAPGSFCTVACNCRGKFRTLAGLYCFLLGSSCVALPNSSGFQDCFANFQELPGLHSLLSGDSCMTWFSIPCPKVQGIPAPLSALGYNKHQFPYYLGFLDP